MDTTRRREIKRAERILRDVDRWTRAALNYGWRYGYAVSINLDVRDQLEFTAKPPPSKDDFGFLRYNQGWANGVLREVGLRSVGHLEAWLRSCGSVDEQRARSREALAAVRVLLQA